MTTSATTANAAISRGPTPLITRIDISTRMTTIWHLGKTKINRLLNNAPPEIRTTHESACRVPYDIVEMIIAHLFYDLPTLKACALTCRSWYTVTLPHLLHTLVLRRDSSGFIGDKLGVQSNRDKLKPLSNLHERGLMSLVKEIRVEQSPDMRPWFLPQAFSHYDLRCFSAFTNVQTLVVQRLKIDHFTPNFQHYFGHFSPTLQSIVLHDPCFTPRQLSHFLSLFSNLDNVEILRTSILLPTTTALGTNPVLSSAPRLRGRLVLYDFHPRETWTHLTTLCGGLRFRYMQLGRVGGTTPVLFEACADTLETLRLNMRDDLASWSQKPILSPLKVLRSLQVKGWLGYWGPREDNRDVRVVDVFSTITSPVFSELVVVVTDKYSFYQPRELSFSETLRKMNEVIPFKLVFSLETLEPLYGKGRRELTKALEFVTANGLLDFLDSPPTTRIARPHDFPLL